MYMLSIRYMRNSVGISGVVLYRLPSLSVHCYSRCQPPAVAPCGSRCQLQCWRNVDHAAETFLFLFFLFDFHCLARCLLRRAAFPTVGSQPRAMPPPRPALPRALPSPARARSRQRCRAGAAVPCRVCQCVRHCAPVPPLQGIAVRCQRLAVNATLEHKCCFEHV